jgi:NAD(P)-dependent dehydrogenase (short-subunit alcohol dehydrogenase family)
VKDLSGKVALVTGAGSGIGRAVALELARAGMDVAVADIGRDRAGAVAEEVRSLGRRATAVACDVSDRVAVNSAAEAAAKTLGPVAVLCANAGVTAFTRFAEMTDQDVDWILGVDLMGVAHCVRSVLPGMIAAGEGHIVTVASMAGLVPTWVPLHVPYTAAKAGVIGLTLNLRPELAERGVGCTVVCPGGVGTNIASAPSYRPERFGGPLDERIRAPAGFVSRNDQSFRRRTPEEVAAMVVDAILEDRMLVVTDAALRGLFEGYAAEVGKAFDAAEDYDRRAGQSAG